MSKYRLRWKISENMTSSIMSLKKKLHNYRFYKYEYERAEKHSKFYYFDIWIVKKTFEFKFHVGQHGGLHCKRLTCHFSLFLQICWPKHFLIFEEFLANIFPSFFPSPSCLCPKLTGPTCWSKYWPTCCQVCARLKHFLYHIKKINATKNINTKEILYNYPL